MSGGRGGKGAGGAFVAVNTQEGEERRVRRIPSISLEQLGLDVVKLGVPSVYSVWVGVDSEIL